MRFAYEVLDDPDKPHPDSPPDAYAWGVRAVGLPANLSAYGVGDTLDEALRDLAEGVKLLGAQCGGERPPGGGG
jgi:hypothetical protein